MRLSKDNVGDTLYLNTIHSISCELRVQHGVIYKVSPKGESITVRFSDLGDIIFKVRYYSPFATPDIEELLNINCKKFGKATLSHDAAMKEAQSKIECFNREEVNTINWSLDKASDYLFRYNDRPEHKEKVRAWLYETLKQERCTWTIKEVPNET